MPINNRIAITKLTAHINLGRDAGQPLKRILANHSRVRRRTAGNKNNSAYITHFIFGHVNAAEVRRTLIQIQTAAYRIFIHHGLVKNLFEHEVLIALFLGLLFIPFNFFHAFYNQLIAEINCLNLRPRNLGHFAIVQKHNFLGVLKHWCGVARDKMLGVAITITDANDKRTPHPRRNQPIRMIRVHYEYAICPPNMFERPQNCTTQHRFISLFPFLISHFLLIMFRNQMCQHFSICLRLKINALQLFFQFPIILNNAIVHYGKFAIHHYMRMSIGFRYPTMCGPTGVGNTYGAFQLLTLHFFGQHVNFADSSDRFDQGFLIQQRHSGAIISPIL